MSAIVSYWADAEVVGRVPPTVFLPRPKVDSALVSITRRAAPASAGEYADEEGGRAGRIRPTAQDAPALTWRGWWTTRAFEETGIRPDARAEELGIAEWGRLAAWTG